MRRHALVFAIVAGALWGCGLLPGVPIGAQGDVPFPGGSCENVPTAMCDEQMQAAANAAGGQVRDVAVRCTGACTRASGAGTSTVTMADGSQITRNWTYVGDPAPIPIPVCIGIAANVCREQVNSMVGDVAVDKQIVRITVRCTDRCDETSGTIIIEYVFGDGTKQNTTSAWE